MKKPTGMQQEVYERYILDGFTQLEIEKIWQDTLLTRSRMKEKSEPREITSSTYERAQKRLNQEIKNMFGIK